ncbi:MAG: ABC transporter permease, partial [Ilumatobacteraceae bacterium]|nr:ABC transporter permease [Ilumatobacteraceae bacterium]
GLGATPPTPSWGRMLASTQQYVLVYPLLVLWPALLISVAVVGATLLGDGLRERLDPTLATK